MGEELDTDLTKEQGYEEQGGYEYVKQTASVAANVAARAAEWSSLVAAEATRFLPPAGRLVSARRLSRARALSRRHDAAERIRQRSGSRK